MVREMIIRCNNCGKQIEKAAGKLYLVPNVPGKKATFLSAYSASGDLCPDCVGSFTDKLDRRQSRNGTSKHKSKTKSSTNT